MSKQISDAQARAWAVDPTRSFIVQAPAGSGKTELLTDRILALLTTVERPEEILAITFTRKAAAEMRERVLEKLERAYGPAPTEPYLLSSWQKAKEVLQKDEALKWNLLDNPSRLRIQTIDSFCQSLVRLTPSLSGAGASLRPTEASATLMSKAVQRVLERADAHESVREVLQHLDVNIDLFIDLLAQMLEKRQGWISFAKQPAQAIWQMVNTLDQIIAQELESLQQLLPLGWFHDLKPIVLEAAQVKHNKLIDDGKDPADNPLACFLQWNGDELGSEIADVRYWKGLAYLLSTDKNLPRSKLDINCGMKPNSPAKNALKLWLDQVRDNTALFTALGTVKTLPEKLVDDNNLSLIEHFFICLSLAEKALQEVFKEEGEVDFTEIALRAQKALGSANAPSDLLLRIDSKLQHILVDEFQDTSLSQKELLDSITAGWQQDEGRTLFLVGDPMQSIYRFRNAEVSLFVKLAQKAEENALLDLDNKKPVIGNVVLELLHLKENFRSDAGVVEWVNEAFEKIFPAQSNTFLGAIQYTPSHPFKEAKPEPAVQYYPFFFKGEKGSIELAQSRQLAQERCYAYTVELIQQALDKAHSVAVLVRSRSHLGELTHHLMQKQIPVQAVKMVPLGQTPEVVDLAQLIRALSHSSDRLAWMSLLRSPFCGLSLVSLSLLFEDKVASTIPQLLRYYLTHEDELVQLIGEEQATRLKFIAQIVLDSTYQRGEINFTSHIEKIWYALGAHRLYHEVAAQKNVQTVLEVVDQLAPYGALDLREFERQLQTLYAAPASDENAVQIMTMHSSKGLEFDEVILFGLERKPPPDKPALLEIENEQGNFLLGSIQNSASGQKDPVSELIKKRNTERLLHEANRLLYVACTRARQKLHLIYLRDEDVEPNKASMLASLEKNIDSSCVCDTGEVVVPDTIPVTEWAFSRTTISRYPLTTIQSLLNSTKHTMPATTESRVGSVWAFEDKTQSAIGTVAHRWLEQMGADRLQGWNTARLSSSARLIQRQLRQLGVLGEELAFSTQRVIHLLQAVLSDEKGRFLLGYPHSHHEWQLMNEEEQIKVVDLLMDTPDGWLVVDYKTNARLADESPEAFAQRLKTLYAAQLQGYANYLHSMDGRPVKTAIYALDGPTWIEF